MAKARPKTARAIEPNAGIRRKFAKKLYSFHLSFSKQFADEIFLHLAKTHAIAKDWSLSNPTTQEDKDLLREVSSAVLAAWKRNPEAFKSDIEGYVDKNIGSWLMNATHAAERLAVWVARCLAADVTSAQRQAYRAAGISSSFMSEKWTIPLIRQQRISPTAARILPELIKWSAELITRTAQRDIERIQQVIVKGFEEGQSVKELRQTLRNTDGFSIERANNVAIDQTNKIVQGIARANDADIGVTEGIWVHVPGEFSSRETHKEMNGSRFDIETGMYDPKEGRLVQPGELPFCRCVYKPVIDFAKIASKNHD